MLPEVGLGPVGTNTEYQPLSCVSVTNAVASVSLPNIRTSATDENGDGKKNQSYRMAAYANK